MGKQSDLIQEIIDDGPKNVYRLGLCLAGAATGGAYSAGVMDFLIEAMNEWEKEKSKGNNSKAAPWDVIITDIVGTSAGGITAALSIASINTSYTPHSQKETSENFVNPLFETWVEEMNKEQLLKSDDIQPSGSTVTSVLSSNFIESTAKKVLGKINPSLPKPKWSPYTFLSLTSTNLRGIPYALDNIRQYDDRDASYYMRDYRDYTEFFATTQSKNFETSSDDQYYLLGRENNMADSPDWDKLITCVRATAAFPFGFPPVLMEKKFKMYDDKLKDHPDWPDDLDGDHKFTAVDGGVLDNVPFEIVENNMTSRTKKPFARDGAEVWGSVVLIDPFPGEVQDNGLAEEYLSLRQLAPYLLGATVGQARFKESVLKDAMSTDCQDKYMISPRHAVRKPIPLATGILNGFGGIIDEKIRYHDFMLGRHNCKNFLENVLLMKSEDAKKSEIFGKTKEKIKYIEENSVNGQIPIIPLVGTAAQETKEPEWPTYSSKEKKVIIDELMKEVDERMGLIVDRFLSEFTRNAGLNILHHFENLVIGIGKRIAERHAKTFIRSQLESAMEVFDEK